jgi:hypothetical protein
MDASSPTSSVSSGRVDSVDKSVDAIREISEWETKRFAVVIVCYKNLFQSIKAITPAILEGYQSVILYSLNCFMDSTYEVILKRSLDITLAFCEFYHTLRGRTNVDDAVIVNDAFLFILQRFPSKYSCDSCSVLSPNAFSHLQHSVQILTNLLQSDIPRFIKNPVEIVGVASKIHYSSGSGSGSGSGDDSSSQSLSASTSSLSSLESPTGGESD